MFVGRHGRAAGEVAQGLEGVVEFVEPIVPLGPPPVAAAKASGQAVERPSSQSLP